MPSRQPFSGPRLYRVGYYIPLRGPGGVAPALLVGWWYAYSAQEASDAQAAAVPACTVIGAEQCPPDVGPPKSVRTARLWLPSRRDDGGGAAGCHGHPGAPEPR